MQMLSCGSSPSSLEGTWRLTCSQAFPMTATFRPGETEALGIIEKVEYEPSGNDVLIRYLGGLMKGSSIRFTVIDKRTIKSQLGTFQRIN